MPHHNFHGSAEARSWAISRSRDRVLDLPLSLSLTMFRSEFRPESSSQGSVEIRSRVSTWHFISPTRTLLFRTQMMSGGLTTYGGAEAKKAAGTYYDLRQEGRFLTVL